jgi:hypothetical protein
MRGGIRGNGGLTGIRYRIFRVRREASDAGFLCSIGISWARLIWLRGCLGRGILPMGAGLGGRGLGGGTFEQRVRYLSDRLRELFFWLGEELHNKFANRRNEWTLPDWSLRDSFFSFLSFGCDNCRN